MPRKGTAIPIRCWAQLSGLSVRCTSSVGLPTVELVKPVKLSNWRRVPCAAKGHCDPDTLLDAAIGTIRAVHV